MPHAVIIHGPPGSAKRSLLLEAIQQRHPDAVTKIKNNTWEYIQIIQRLEDKKSIGIEQVKSAEELIRLKESHPRYIVIEEAHLLTREAQNAFLKTIEEPPANTHIVLLTRYKGDLLPTIQSRCQHVQLTPPTREEFCEYAEKELGFDSETANKLFYATNANVHEAARLSKDEDALREILELVHDARKFIASDLAGRVAIAQNILAPSSKLQGFNQVLIAMCRAALISVADKSIDSVAAWTSRLELLLRAERRRKNHVQPRIILAELMLEL